MGYVSPLYRHLKKVTTLTIAESNARVRWRIVMLHYLYGPDDVVIEVTDSDDEDVIPIAEPDLLPDEDEDEDEEDDDDEDDEFDEDEDEDDEPIEPEPTDEPAVDD